MSTRMRWFQIRRQTDIPARFSRLFFLMCITSFSRLYYSQINPGSQWKKTRTCGKILLSLPDFEGSMTILRFISPAEHYLLVDNEKRCENHIKFPYRFIYISHSIATTMEISFFAYLLAVFIPLHSFLILWFFSITWMYPAGCLSPSSAFRPLLPSSHPRALLEQSDQYAENQCLVRTGFWESLPGACFSNEAGAGYFWCSEWNLLLGL